MDNPKTDLRQKAIDWLNSGRNLDSGLEILKEAGYKPHVISNFYKNRSRRDIPKKILQEVRNYIRYCTNPQINNSVHEDEPPVGNPDEKFEGNIDKELQKEYPGIIKQLLTDFRDLYIDRSKQHAALKAVGEANDEKSMGERKRVSMVIDAESRRMDTLWKAFEEYKTLGLLPGESLFAEPFNPETIVEQKNQKKEKPFILPDDAVSLKKMSENWRTKIVKAENKLQYQSEKQGDKPNPIPVGPKRITQEKRISQLKEEKLAIDTKIAELK
ncbi:hypothetical protein M2132_001810 [Dysgonomonas sp. PH5-45]|uniref:hypothetical protein n=1 Tax=unclassified Dysgonomonas TaxID=2630389 RepID=UPI0024750537|nr:MULTISPECIES: hypothetical protein [unclassified Dysgonomonas]MDH6355467.1 hypothetical protein [Dysgonomonas sp. PH5-45]MDH6388363.1 hypothetical protein [Dysgonomonas sp. PH5-37]